MKALRIIPLLTIAVLCGIAFAFIPQSFISVSTGVGAVAGYTTIQDNGTPLTQQPFLNFIAGSNITLTLANDGGATRTNVTIAGQAGPTTNQNYRTFGVTFDGGGSALSGTTTRCTQVNYAGTINEFTMLGDQSGNATVTVKTVAFGSYTGPASTSDISGGGETMTGSVSKQDTTLSGWTTAFSANTAVCFVLSSPATVTWVSANVRISAN